MCSSVLLALLKYKFSHDLFWTRVNVPQDTVTPIEPVSENELSFNI